MKKFAFVAVMAIAVAMFTACGNSSKKSDSNTTKDEDSLAYAMGLVESQQVKMAMSQLGVDSANIDEFIKGVKAGMKNTSNKKKQAYNMGLLVGISENMRFKQQLYPQLFANDSTKTLPMDKFMAGFTAGLKNKKGMIDPQQAQIVVQTTGKRIQDKSFEKAYGQNKRKSDAYMANVAKQPGVKPLGNGVYYKEVKAGTGKTPTAQDVVKVDYNLMDISGKSLEKQNDAVMPVNGVILGWQIALSHMKEGDTWEIYIPYDAAYGAQNSGPIKPFSALHFTVTLKSVQQRPQGPQGGQAPQQVQVR